MKEVLIFIISMLVPMVYWRTLSYMAKDYMKRPFLRTKTKLQIHHLHHGIVLVFIASVILLFWDKNNYVIILLGLSSGLMLDSFIPSIIMKAAGGRKRELIIYRKSFMQTLILFIALILIVVMISLLTKI